MRTKIIVYAICIFIILIIQSTMLESIAIYDIKPNLILIFIVSIGLLRGNVEGAYVGFFAGLAQDILSGQILGFYALLGLYLGLLIGSINKRLYRENFFVIMLFTCLSTIVYEFLVFFFNIYLESGSGFLYAFGRIILPETIYNVVLSVFMYVFVIKLNDRFNEQDKSSRKY